MANWERKYFDEHEARMLGEKNFLAVSAYEDRIRKNARTDFTQFAETIAALYAPQGYVFSKEDMRLRHPDWHDSVYLHFWFDDGRGRYEIASRISYEMEKQVFGLPERLKISCPVFPSAKKRAKMVDDCATIIGSAVKLNAIVMAKIAKDSDTREKINKTMSRLLLAGGGKTYPNLEQISTEKVGCVRIMPEAASFEFTLDAERAEQFLRWAKDNL